MVNLSRGVIVFLFFILIGTTQILSANFISAAEKIDINTALLENLVKIIHIGEVRAKELISLRPFSSLDDLTKIKGISSSRIEDIKKQGLAQVDPEETEKELIETKPQLENPKPKLIVYPSGIVINEILPSPKGPDPEEEWIEIFNQNNFEVDLTNWQITDSVGNVKTYTFPEKTIIKSKGYLILPRPASKITLNNSGDSLKLIQPDENIVDSVEYEKAQREKSFNRTEEGWIWSNNLTPGSANIIPVPVLEIKEVKELTLEKEIAAISQQIPEENSLSLFISLIALAFAIFSGIIILTLKKKVKSS